MPTYKVLEQDTSCSEDDLVRDGFKKVGETVYDDGSVLFILLPASAGPGKDWAKKEGLSHYWMCTRYD